MKPPSTNFRRYLGSWFDDEFVPEAYVEGCENAPTWLDAGPDRDGIRAFRDELAAHIRDASFPPASPESQWTSDEWLRNIWYDAFGPQAPPGDPFPVPDDLWGHARLTPYMLHAVDEGPADSSPGAAAWLERRGLTFVTVQRAIMQPAHHTENVRAAPKGWHDHLRQLTDQGLRDAKPGEGFSS
ncbi:MAG TPA: hypothetical protein VIP77_00290 [Jiangellaceae bacterium]